MQATRINFLGNQLIDSLLHDRKWADYLGGKQLSYSFYEDSVFNGSYSGRETGVSEVSESVKNNVRSIFNWLENVIDLDFVEVKETTTNYGSMRFMLSFFFLYLKLILLAFMWRSVNNNIRRLVRRSKL